MATRSPRSKASPRPLVHGAEARSRSKLEAVNAALQARNRQQAAVAELGQQAIRDRDLAPLLDEAAAVSASTLGTEFSAIGQRLEGSQDFVLRAGVGWPREGFGIAASSISTPVEWMLRTSEPLVIRDIRSDPRFSAPQPLLDRGVRSALYVAIRGREAPWGNLSVYTTRRRRFDTDDIGFLQSIANVVALAVERQTLELSREREREMLQAIFDNIPVMISVYDQEGRLVRANREWEKTLGWTAEEARKVDLLQAAYPDPEARREATEFIHRAECRWGDFRMLTRDGEKIDASWARFRLSDGHGIGFGLNLRERKAAERALAESESRFSTLFQASPVALSMSTPDDGRIAAANRAWLDLLGYELPEVVGRTNQELGLSVDLAARNAIMRQLRLEGRVLNVEMQCRKKSGEIREVILSAVLVRLSDGIDYALAALTDISERKRIEAERDLLILEARTAQERLEALSRRLLSAQEEERRRLAVELHDELGQVLTAVKIELESLTRNSGPAATPPLSTAIASVDLALRRVRDLALDLRPSVLDDLGLPPALRWYADRFARDTGLEVHVAVDAVPGLPQAVATACFRVAQEALTNVVRHAGARSVGLTLCLGSDTLDLRVKDDGTGFDVAAARRCASLGGSIGLLGMEERVSHLGGRFDVRSSGDGTEVSARFPFRSPSALPR